MTTYLSDRPHEDDAGYPDVDTPVRLIQPSPRGARNTMNLTDSAHLGAVLASEGMTSAEVTALLQELTTIGIKNGVEALPKVMEKIRRVNVARLNELIQQVRGLPSIQMPAAGWRGMLGQPQVASPVYVSLDQVLGILDRAKADPSR